MVRQKMQPMPFFRRGALDGSSDAGKRLRNGA